MSRRCPLTCIIPADSHATTRHTSETFLWLVDNRCQSEPSQNCIKHTLSISVELNPNFWTVELLANKELSYQSTKTWNSLLHRKKLALVQTTVKWWFQGIWRHLTDIQFSFMCEDAFILSSKKKKRELIKVCCVRDCCGANNSLKNCYVPKTMTFDKAYS